jgi:hypothetical protein
VAIHGLGGAGVQLQAVDLVEDLDLWNLRCTDGVEHAVDLLDSLQALRIAGVDDVQ